MSISIDFYIHNNNKDYYSFMFDKRQINYDRRSNAFYNLVKRNYVNFEYKYSMNSDKMLNNIKLKEIQNEIMELFPEVFLWKLIF